MLYFGLVEFEDVLIVELERRILLVLAQYAITGNHEVYLGAHETAECVQVCTRLARRAR